MAGSDPKLVQAALPRAVTHARCGRGRRKASSVHSCTSARGAVARCEGTAASPLPLPAKSSVMGLGVRAEGRNPPRTRRKRKDFLRGDSEQATSALSHLGKS